MAVKRRVSNRQQRLQQQRKIRILSAILVTLFLLLFALVMVPTTQNYLLAHKQDEMVAKYNQTDHGSTMSKYLKDFYHQKTKTTYSDPFSSESSSNSSSKHSVDAAKAILKPVATLSVPRMKEVLPIFGNFSPDSFDNGVGSDPNSGSLSGGKGNHLILASHSGKSIGRLFTDLPKVQLKDKFFIRVKGSIHAYQVDRILEVNPNIEEKQGMPHLQPVPGKDYVTLITCTNGTQTRLLVRGHRVKYVPKENTGAAGGLTPLGLLILVTSAITLIVLFGAGFYYRKQIGSFIHKRLKRK
ncbi:sortase [Lactiplantibacillus plantarum]|uniref:sortase n=1 Tax=Lactiplantibacillus plantarum TaxID=1590 RepID=UPI002000D6C7|nr:sortase [Lactiplantibacillus plantarum]